MALSQEERANNNKRIQTAISEYKESQLLPTRNIFSAINYNAFYKQHQILTIAGRPDAGKTQIAMYIAKSQLEQNIPVHYMAFEETRANLYSSFVRSLNPDQLENLKVDGVGDGELEKVLNNIKIGYDLGYEFFVIDQLSLIDVDTVPTIREKYDKFQRELLKVVMELPITVLQVSQLNRDAKESNEPEYNLAESDRILQNTKWLGVVSKIDDIDKQTKKLRLQIRKSKIENGEYADYEFKYDYNAMFMFDVFDFKEKPKWEGL